MVSTFSGSQATTGYARTQTDADKFNTSSDKPAGLTFVVPSISDLVLDSLLVAPVKGETPNTDLIEARQYTITFAQTEE